MFLEEITIKNLLSFGPKGVTLPLRPLNVLIGPNGSGKSNFLDVISFLKALPDDAWEPMRRGRSFEAWRHQGVDGNPNYSADLDMICRVLQLDDVEYRVRHAFSCDLWSTPSVSSERVTRPLVSDPDGEGEIQFIRDKEQLAYAPSEGPSVLVPHDFHDDQSILSQLTGIDSTSFVRLLVKRYRSIRLYRDWHFGRSSPVRNPGSTAAMAESLDEDWSNFIPVLNEIQGVPALKRRLVEQLRDLYDGLNDFYVQVAQDNMILWLYEGDRKVPASRLSDGTVRYMCLLAILLNPTPPPLVCIEEPELGLHPDLVVRVADLLKEASTRMQLVVTTHSDMLLDALSDTPESIVVCSKEEGETVMTRLDAEEMRPYLEEHGLSHWWNSGTLGGRRW